MIIVIWLLGVLVGGVIIAMGGGGGAFYLWILTNVAGVSVASATATSLFTALPALLVGAYSQYKTGNIHFKAGNRMALSAIPTVFIGSWLAHFLPQRLYSIIIGLIFIIMGAKVLKKSFGHQNKAHYSSAQAYFYGGLSGALVGIAGLSGGGALVSGLLLMGLSMPEAAATSSYALIATTIVGMLAHVTQSSIAWLPGITLMLGAILGSAVTPRIISRFSREKVTKLFSPIMGVIMMLMALTYLF